MRNEVNLSAESLAGIDKATIKPINEMKVKFGKFNPAIMVAFYEGKDEAFGDSYIGMCYDEERCYWYTTFMPKSKCTTI